jgi:hypothetical protein
MIPDMGGMIYSRRQLFAKRRHRSGLMADAHRFAKRARFTDGLDSRLDASRSRQDVCNRATPLTAQDQARIANVY